MFSELNRVPCGFLPVGKQHEPDGKCDALKQPHVKIQVNVFVKNVTDPVGEFWEKNALEQTSGVSWLQCFTSR